MIVAILQARLSSRRLPGKVLRPIIGRPMMGRQIDRVRRAARLDRLIVATSREAGDDLIEAFCQAEALPCYRGPLEDVLARFAGAAASVPEARHVVRLTADCPLADPAVIDACVARHLEQGADYTSNIIERTYPDGLDVEVMTVEALARTAQEASTAYQREHVTPYIYQTPGRFRLDHLTQAEDLGALRWTVDTEADFRMVSAVFDALLPRKPAFAMQDVLDLLRERPEIAALNA